MKKILYFLVLSSWIISTAASNLPNYGQKVRIILQLDRIAKQDMKGFLCILDKKWERIDSVQFKNGKAVLNYSPMKNIALAQIIIKSIENNKNIMKDVYFKNVYSDYMNLFLGDLYLDNKDLHIDLHMRDSTSFIGNISQLTDNMEVAFIRQRDSEIDYAPKGTSPTRWYFDNRGCLMNEKLVNRYPHSRLLLQEICEHITAYKDTALLYRIYNSFADSLKNTKDGMSVKQYIQEIRKNSIQQFFPFFDTKGKKYSFKDCIGNKKYLVIVFWASWCAPCRREIPDLIDLYNRYKRDVAFINLSVDENKKAWIKAVQKDKVSWLSLACFQYSKNNVSQKMRVTVFPSFIVTNSDGNIILDSRSGYNQDCNNKAFCLQDLSDYLLKEIKYE